MIARQSAPTKAKVHAKMHGTMHGTMLVQSRSSPSMSERARLHRGIIRFEMTVLRTFSYVHGKTVHPLAEVRTSEARVHERRINKQTQKLLFSVVPSVIRSEPSVLVHTFSAQPPGYAVGMRTSLKAVRYVPRPLEKYARKSCSHSEYARG